MPTSTSLNLRALLKTAVARSGMDAPARLVSGLTPSAKALYVAAAAQTLPHGVVLYVVPGDGDLEQAVADVRFFVAALEGLADAAAEHARAAVPLARGRSLSRHDAAPRRRLGARARPARGGGGQRARDRRLGAGAPSARQRAIADARRVDRPSSGPGHRADRSRRAARRRRLQPRGSGRRARRIRAARRHPRRLSDWRDAAGAPRVHRRHHRIDPQLRPGDAALDGRRRSGPDRAAAGCPGTTARAPAARARSSTTSRTRRHRASSSPSATKWTRPRRSSPRSSSTATRKRSAARNSRPRPPNLFADWTAIAARLATATTLAELGLTESQIPNPESQHVRTQPSIELRGPRRRLGGRDSAAPAGRGVRALRGGDHRPRRAHDRAAEGIRRLRRARRARRGRAVRRRARRHRRAVARLPPARRLVPDLRRDRRVRRGSPRARAAAPGDPRVPVRPARPQGRRLRRPRRPRHRRLRRPEADRRRHRRRAGIPRAALRRRGQALRPRRAARPRAEIHRRDPTAGRSPRRHDVGAREDEGQESHARHGGGAAEALRRAQGRAGPRLQPRHALAGGIRGRVRIRADARPEDGDRRHQARHGVVDADGPPALRRRRLRQDRGRDARRVQGGDGRQAGRLPRADHRPRVSAPEDAQGALRRLPREDRHGEPLPLEDRAEGHARRPRRRPARHHRRHASAAVEGRRVPRPRPARRRRGAALRRLAQGEDQAAPEEGRRAHDERDADSADAEHVARRHPRHVDHRDAAEGSPVDPDQRRQIRFSR